MVSNCDLQSSFAIKKEKIITHQVSNLFVCRDNWLPLHLSFSIMWSCPALQLVPTIWLSCRLIMRRARHSIAKLRDTRGEGQGDAEGEGLMGCPPASARFFFFLLCPFVCLGVFVFSPHLRTSAAHLIARRVIVVTVLLSCEEMRHARSYPCSSAHATQTSSP